MIGLGGFGGRGQDRVYLSWVSTTSIIVLVAAVRGRPARVPLRDVRED